MPIETRLGAKAARSPEKEQPEAKECSVFFVCPTCSKATDFKRSLPNINSLILVLFLLDLSSEEQHWEEPFVTAAKNELSGRPFPWTMWPSFRWEKDVSKWWERGGVPFRGLISLGIYLLWQARSEAVPVEDCREDWGWTSTFEQCNIFKHVLIYLQYYLVSIFWPITC